MLTLGIEPSPQAEATAERNGGEQAILLLPLTRKVGGGILGK